jgi:hypothetical protein
MLVGFGVGLVVGSADGRIGDVVGLEEGEGEGVFVGLVDGELEGMRLGLLEGSPVGLNVGLDVGIEDGDGEGSARGDTDGIWTQCTPPQLASLLNPGHISSSWQVKCESTFRETR